MKNDIEDIQLIISAHFSALVTAMNETSPGFKDNFTTELHEIHNRSRSSGVENLALTQSVANTIELLMKK